jgi:hypothetical protein
MEGDAGIDDTVDDDADDDAVVDVVESLVFERCKAGGPVERTDVEAVCDECATIHKNQFRGRVRERNKNGGE